MNRIPYFLWLLISLSAVVSAAQFATVVTVNAAEDEVVTVATAWPVDRARPGDSMMLAIVADIKEGFHINADSRQAGPSEDFTPYPTRVTVQDATIGVITEPPRYPRAVAIEVAYTAQPLMSFEGQIVIYLPIKLEESMPPGKLTLRLEFGYQACAENYCLLPRKIRLEDSLDVTATGAGASQVNSHLFAGSTQQAVDLPRSVDFGFFGWNFSIDISSGPGMALLLLIAALGGMLLNFTPCVLPLIPIKIISISHVSKDRRQCFLLGLTMSLGVLAFWVILGMTISLVSGFSATNQLFQYPGFTIGVGLVIGVMATGMFGFFSMRLPNWIYMINPEQDTFSGSFGLGILAAILSTPCTAPFMGAAAAWAATQTATTSLATFAAIGTGMALPYLVLAASPGWVQKMPKTGPASELIKQIMGLFMLAAAAYFIGVGIESIFSSPTSPPGKIYWWPVMLFCMAAGGWLTYRTIRISPTACLKTIFAGIGLIVVATSVWAAVRLTDRGPIDWIYYSPPKFEAAAADRKIIVLVFTAEWCLNCKALEQSVLKHPSIVNVLKREAVVPMKVDITGNNPAGKAKLQEVGSLTIPLLVVYSPNGDLLFKSDFYTVDQVLDAVNRGLLIAAEPL